MLRFRVPASTTNLGHGFDCLGLALDLSNTISVEPHAKPQIEAPGAPDDGLARMANQVREACQTTWRVSLPGFTVSVTGDVPVARGLGSSATILCGVAAACQALAKRPADPGELIPIAAAIEGHPDNVAAACLGGFTVIGAVAGNLVWQRFAAPDALRAVVVIPSYEVKTSEARRILPQTTTRGELVTALQRTALIVAAMARGDIAAWSGLFADAWHEGHRAQLNPALARVRPLAAAAGAIGTILSGSGSTVLAFCSADRADAVARAVQNATPDALVRTVTVAARGVTAI